MFLIDIRNLANIRLGLTVVFSFFLSLFCEGQEAGATLYAGISNARLHENTICQKCNFQSGYVLGFDARLNSGSLHFLVSGDYATLDLIPKAKNDYFSKDKMQLFKLKAGMGFRLIKFSDNVFLSSKGQLAFTSFFKYDDEPLFERGLQLNDGVLGAATGLMFNYGALMFELEYERGILNMFYERPETNIDFITLKTGFKF